MISSKDKSFCTYKKIEQSDRKWIEDFMEHHWVGDLVIVHGTEYKPSVLDGYIELKDDKKVGLITYNIEKDKCEIITLNSLIEKKGIGTSLVNLVETEAKEYGCDESWLITTNDNINAIMFYQKIGYQLLEVFSGSSKFLKEN